ncbi:MAG TPA: class I SAM-dependent methyltransferase [Rhodospirillales bacterium]|nr:class I SAM-dependent methyltransferase [Rhodospirillales bacterium]
MSDLCQHRTTCRLCGGSALTRVLALKASPPANAFVAADQLDTPQQTFPLDVFFCQHCHHVQLLDVVDAKVLFENYVYVSATSPVFVKHFEDYAQFVIDRYNPPAGSLVFDIGSNDGTLLRAFKNSGHDVLGVDPAKDIAAAASADGIETISGFFSGPMAEEIRAERGSAAVITANNVFAHIDDLGGVLDGIHLLLDDDGVFVFEVSYLLDMFENTLFDMIYHEHLAYHTVEPLIAFMAAHNMELIDVQRVPSHGGSLRAVCQTTAGTRPVDGSVAGLVGLEKSLGLDKAATYQDFGNRIDALGAELSALLQDLKTQGRSIAAFGAPAKATTLMYHFGIGADLIDFIVDDSPLKQGLYSPGMHIPVLPSSAIYDRKPDNIVILAWNFAAPIMAKHKQYTDAGGRFIVPLPRLEIFR